MAETKRIERDIFTRIRGEYQEMPGMRLTLAQAARLFDLDPTDCASVLTTLVRDGALWTNGQEFLRRNVGRRVA
jgi:hypothetical protein